VSTRDRLLEAADLLSQAHALNDIPGRRLPEPERGALLMLRGELEGTLRRLRNLAAWLPRDGAS
jgi:hypothetical protein